MSEDDINALALMGAIGAFVLLLVGWGVYEYTRAPTEFERVGAAIRTSIEGGLKGQPLRVVNIEDVFKASDRKEYYGARVRVWKTGAEYAEYFRAYLSRVCDDAEPKCWHLDEVIETRGPLGDGKFIDIQIYLAADIATDIRGPAGLYRHSDPITTGSIGSPSPAGVGG